MMGSYITQASIDSMVILHISPRSHFSIIVMSMQTKNISIDADLAARTKVYASSQGVSIKEWVERVLTAELNKNGAPMPNTGQYVPAEVKE